MPNLPKKWQDSQFDTDKEKKSANRITGEDNLDNEENGDLKDFENEELIEEDPKSQSQ